jgi:hypothetical protein
MVAPKPIRLTDPFITLGTDDAIAVPPTTAHSFQCFSNGIHLTGEANDDLSTFCDPEGFAYTLSLDLKMSLGAESLDAAFTALGGPGTVVPFEFAYTGDPASADNPHWSGDVRIPAIPVVDAGINEATSFTIDMPVIGDIARDDGAGFMTYTTRTHTHETTTPVETVAA